MPDREPSHEEFAKAADRRAYEREQLLQSAPEETRRLVADMAKRAEKEKENRQREQQKRYRDDVEKQKARIRDRDRQAYRPRWATDRLTEKRIQEIAAKEVQENNKAQLNAIDKKLDKDTNAILAAHAPEKKRELDKEREITRDLTKQKRQDRQATRLEPQPAKNREAGGKDRDSKGRSDEELRKRVAENMRKAKARDARARTHDRERE